MDLLVEKVNYKKEIPIKDRRLINGYLRSDKSGKSGDLEIKMINIADQEDYYGRQDEVPLHKKGPAKGVPRYSPFGDETPALFYKGKEVFIVIPDTFVYPKDFRGDPPYTRQRGGYLLTLDKPYDRGLKLIFGYIANVHKNPHIWVDSATPLKMIKKLGI